MIKFGRKLIMYILLIIGISVNFNGSVEAQTTSLDQYLELLNSNNILLQQSTNQIKSSETDTRAARAAFLPVVATEFNYQRDFTKSFMYLNDDSGFLPEKFQTNFNNSFRLDVIVEQSIYNPASKLNLQLAELGTTNAQLNHTQLSKELVNNAARLYWQALFAKSSLTVLEENLKLAKDQWQQMQLLFDQGVITELQLKQAELYYQQSIPALNSAKNTYQVLINELKALANLPQDYQLEPGEQLEASLEDHKFIMMEKSNLDHNTELQALSLQNKMALKQIKTAKSAKYPQVKARVGYNFNSFDNAFRLKNNNNLVYGQISLQIPIYSGGLIDAQVQKARINQENAQLEIRHKQRNLEKDFTNAKLNLANAAQKIQEVKAAIRLSERELEIGEHSLKLGTLTALEIREMRQGLTQNKLNLICAWLDWRIAKLQMEKVLGTTIK